MPLVGTAAPAQRGAPHPQAVVHRTAGDRALASGWPDIAAAHFQRALDEWPSDGIAAYGLARAALALGRTAEARSAFAIAARLLATSAPARAAAAALAVARLEPAGPIGSAGAGSDAGVDSIGLLRATSAALDGRCPPIELEIVRRTGDPAVLIRLLLTAPHVATTPAMAGLPGSCLAAVADRVVAELRTRVGQAEDDLRRLTWQAQQAVALAPVPLDLPEVAGDGAVLDLTAQPHDALAAGDPDPAVRIAALEAARRARVNRFEQVAGAAERAYVHATAERRRVGRQARRALARVRPPHVERDLIARRTARAADRARIALGVTLLPLALEAGAGLVPSFSGVGGFWLWLAIAVGSGVAGQAAWTLRGTARARDLLVSGRDRWDVTARSFARDHAMLRGRSDIWHGVVRTATLARARRWHPPVLVTPADELGLG